MRSFIASEKVTTRSTPKNFRCLALLGRKDQPTDAVEEYCEYLAAAMRERGIPFEVVRLRWDEIGWRAAIADLLSRSSPWQGAWALVQYTALAWSRRGFPVRVPGLLRLLKKSGMKCGIVFHDAEPYHGKRLLDRLRRKIQLYTMRKAFHAADHVILPIPAQKIPWIPRNAGHSTFIPVGANLPNPERAWKQGKSSSGGPPTVAAFSLSSGKAGAEEIERIAKTVVVAAESVGRLRLALAGRNSEEAGARLRDRCKGSGVEVVALGLLPAEEVVRLLGSADVMLFARGPLSSRRSSAIAGIACGLPVIAREGWETAAPVTEAGVVLVPADAQRELGEALSRVLKDAGLRASLAARSRIAQERYFSWQAIAASYADALSRERLQ